MAKLNINIGSGELAGDGESLRGAFDKTNQNFTEVYNDIAVLTANQFSGDYNDLTNKPTIPVDISELADITGLLNSTGDIKGSVFADDSTLLVDGVSSKINLQNTVLNNTISTSDENFFINTAATPGDRGFTNITTTDNILDIQGAAALPGGQGGGIYINGGIPFDDPSDYTRYGDIIISGRIVSILAGDGEGGGGLAIAGPVVGTTTMDIKGSVFGDDSTLLVDAVSGSIPYSVISGAPTVPTDLNQLTDNNGLLLSPTSIPYTKFFATGTFTTGNITPFQEETFANGFANSADNDPTLTGVSEVAGQFSGFDDAVYEIIVGGLFNDAIGNGNSEIAINADDQVGAPNTGVAFNRVVVGGNQFGTFNLSTVAHFNGGAENKFQIQILQNAGNVIVTECYVIIKKIG